jgi:lysozyme
MARRATWWQARRWPLVLAAVLLCVPAAAWGWWQAAHWAPDRAAFPVQGVLLGAGDGAVDLRVLAATGARFAYLEASRGAAGRDPRFAQGLAAGQAAGLSVGALHLYDPCAPADAQAANFVITVPRDPRLLPPAVALARTADACADPVAAAGLEGELTTFLNQIERHAGAPAILAISPEFEERHQLAGRFDRGLWLAGDWLQPGYAGRPWTLWTANEAYRSEAAEAPLRWVVAQP